MKKSLLMFSFLLHLFSGRSQSPDLSRYPDYAGTDLGLTYGKTHSLFRVWAPTALEVQLSIYEKGDGGKALQVVSMLKAENGTWIKELRGDWQGKFYTYKARFAGKKAGQFYWSEEVTDPYARAVGINGKRAMVLDLAATNPAGWEKDKSPVAEAPTDAILYELHVRDASIAAGSGIKAKGKFLGLTEKNTRNKAGLSTGLDHLKELGVTHIHLLPVFDYRSVDETVTDKPQYNWGYDPLNYNTPEGSYATDASDGAVRIREFKQLVRTFHENGLRVVMDVVYNHTALTENSNFNQLVPGYYYRQNKEGKFSDATACGNETASERSMMRKFILESVLYWVREFHVDGFRFDLMGVHDIETMNLISRELHAIRPDILLYGEGWTAGASPLPDSTRALKANVSKLDRIAVFGDDLRDGIKGSVFDAKDKGFVTGKAGTEESVKFGIVGAVQHPQVDYKKVNYSKAPYATSPSQVISYAECHDNHTLWDKILLTGAPDDTQDAPASDMEQMHRLALSVILTSQGIPFLHAGTEFLRTKEGVENSYNSPDGINRLDWDRKTQYKDLVEYVKGLVALRKGHPAFRMRTAEAIRANLQFDGELAPGLIAYRLNGKAVQDKWATIKVFFNGTATQQSISLGKENWKWAVKNSRFVQGESCTGAIELPPFSCAIIYQEDKP